MRVLAVICVHICSFDDGYDTLAIDGWIWLYYLIGEQGIMPAPFGPGCLPPALLRGMGVVGDGGTRPYRLPAGFCGGAALTVMGCCYSAAGRRHVSWGCLPGFSWMQTPCFPGCDVASSPAWLPVGIEHLPAVCVLHRKAPVSCCFEMAGTGIVSAMEAPISACLVCAPVGVRYGSAAMERWSQCI